MATGANSSKLCCDNDDEDSSPECLLPSEPVHDVYNSDNSVEVQNKVDKNRRKRCEIQTSTPRKLKDNLGSSAIKAYNLQLQGDERERKNRKGVVTTSMTENLAHSSGPSSFSAEDLFNHKDQLHLTSAINFPEEPKNASQLGIQLLAKLTHATYDRETAEINYFEAEDPSLECCLEQLLDFALKENTGRRTLVDGKKLFDGKTAPEIVQLWRMAHPELNWIIENFNHDLGQFNLDETKHWIKENTVLKSEEEYRNFNLTKKCLSFVKKFVSRMDLLKEYESGSIRPSSSHDKLHDKFKSIVSDIGNLLNIEYRNPGECKHLITISAYDESNGVMTEQRVLCKPDIVFSSDDGTLLFPVQVHTPMQIPENKGFGIASDKTQNQIDTQHTIQHIGLLMEKVMKLYRVKVPFEISYNELENPHVSVGMIVNRNVVQFSKVMTTHKHLSSFLQNLLPSELRHERVDIIAAEMQRNVQTIGLVVINTDWHIDLAKGVHRNALMMFFVHYFWGHDYFVQHKVEIKI